MRWVWFSVSAATVAANCTVEFKSAKIASSAPCTVVATVPTPFAASRPFCIASTTRLICSCVVRTLVRTSSAERALCSASLRTSPATTRKPSPCWPARAASIAALSASRSVWLAIRVMPSTSLPISRDSRSSTPATSDAWSMCTMRFISSALARATSSPRLCACSAISVICRSASRARAWSVVASPDAALASDLANDVPDRGRGAVDADAEESQLVAGRGSAAFHLACQVAALDLAEHAACRPQAVDDLHEHRHERHAGEHEHQAFLDVERPAPPVPGDLRHHRNQREGGQVDDERAPRFAALEIQRGLQRRDQVRTVEDMAVRSHGEQHRGNEQAPDREIELRVPGLERLPLHEAAHTGVRGHEAHGEHENEPPRDGDDAGELDGAEERDPESHEAPAGARVRQHVLALLGESLRDELMLESDHMRNR